MVVSLKRPAGADGPFSHAQDKARDDRITRMAKRASGNPWMRIAKQQTRWIMRQAASEGKRALRLSTRAIAIPSKPRASTKVPGESWSAGMAPSCAGMRRYRLFKPPGLVKGAAHPLLVMLHGCGQNADDFSASTRMNRLAAVFGFMVLYPEQDRLANLQMCWNWFETRNGRAKLEAASIVAVLDHVCGFHAIDPARVAIAGMSAGASMAALVALHFSSRFAAVIMHSGVEPTLANSPATALAAMHGRYRAPTRLPSRAASVLPALLVIHGSADHAVFKANGMRAAQTWAARAQAQPGEARVVRRGKRYPFTTMDWFVGNRLQVTLSEINGLGHAWSGGAASRAYSDAKGPDASRMVWAFAQQQFGLRTTAVKRMHPLSATSCIHHGSLP